MKRIPRKFNIKPTLAMSIILILWVPKTMALGGVATGNMKAKEQERVPGIIKKRGFRWIEIARAAKTGRRISAVAVLEVSSVKKVMNKQTIVTINIGDRELIPWSRSPIQEDRRLTLNPLANAKPPPKRMTIFQGNLEVLFQSMIRPFVTDLVGIRNRIKAMAMETVPSLTYCDFVRSEDHPGIVKPPMLILARNIHKHTKRRKSKRTIFSS